MKLIVKASKNKKIQQKHKVHAPLNREGLTKSRNLE